MNALGPVVVAMNSLPSRRFFPLRVPAIHARHGLSLILVFLLLSSAHSNAQSQYVTLRPDSADTPRADVRGVVIDSATGEPIPRALVTLGGREFHSMLTGGDGGFSFDEIPVEHMYVQARRPGYFEGSLTFVRPDKTKDLVVKLTPAGLIFGQVVDENGEPIESAQVRLMQQRMFFGKRKWVNGPTAQTNDRGQYRLPDLRPGNYIVAVGPVMDGSSGEGKTGYATSFYPKAPDPASATPIHISAGEQNEADFELSRVPVFKVAGVVTGPKTQGINVFLTDTSGSQIGIFARQDQATGQFEIRGVPRGTYTLRAQGSVEQGDPLVASAEVTVNADVSGVALLLHAPIVIPIDVRGDPQQPVEVSSGPSSPHVPPINIQAISETNDEGGYMIWEGPPDNGRLVLHLPGPGTYNIIASSYGSSYIRSATSGNTDLLTNPLVVPSSGGVDPIEIVLASDGARVNGVVRGTIGPALVVAVPDSEGRQPAVLPSAVQGGQFSFRSLAPGDYSFYAIHPREQMDYSDRDALTPFRSKAVHVTLTPNQSADITLDLIESD